MAHFLVIAASSGIGQETVALLKAANHSVFTTARDTSKITPDALLDASDFDAVEAIFKQAGLTLAAAATYAPMNLRVNAIAPGLTETPLTASLTANETSRKISEAMHALGRLGHPADIARAIVFLLDPANSWITGQVLAVDGGLSSLRPKMKL